MINHLAAQQETPFRRNKPGSAETEV